jgi:hypothetical protein
MNASEVSGADRLTVPSVPREERASWWALPRTDHSDDDGSRSEEHRRL